MPLLQLFKVFSGYHAIAYDLQIQNAIVAGYGMGAANHYHTYDGGERVAHLLQTVYVFNHGRTLKTRNR